MGPACTRQVSREHPARLLLYKEKANFARNIQYQKIPSRKEITRTCGDLQSVQCHCLHWGFTVSGVRETTTLRFLFKELLGHVFPLVTLVQIQGNPTEAGDCSGFLPGTDAWVWPTEVTYTSVTSLQLVLLYTRGDWVKKLAQLLLRKRSVRVSKCYFKYRGFSFHIYYSELKRGWSFLAKSKCYFRVCIFCTSFFLYHKPSTSTFPKNLFGFNRNKFCALLEVGLASLPTKQCPLSPVEKWVQCIQISYNTWPWQGGTNGPLSSSHLLGGLFSFGFFSVGSHSASLLGEVCPCATLLLRGRDLKFFNH